MFMIYYFLYVGYAQK
uniref:Uncharacterized protein n=1 Tax=Anguilla anguilla TaxID=7936 RepID=A0A0E9SIC1_ANGAN